MYKELQFRNSGIFLYVTCKFGRKQVNHNEFRSMDHLKKMHKRISSFLSIVTPLMNDLVLIFLVSVLLAHQYMLCFVLIFSKGKWTTTFKGQTGPSKHLIFLILKHQYFCSISKIFSLITN